MPAVFPSVIRFGKFQVDLEAGELHKNGFKVKLQEQPFRILALLLARPGDVLTREELRQKLWAADTFVEFDDGLNVAIRKLRRALGDSAENPRFIETLPRRGYRFIAPVLSEAEAARRPQPPVGEVKARSAPVRPWLPPLGLAAAVLVVSAIFLAATRQTKLRSDNNVAQIAPRRSVAVLGFRNVSDRPDTAWYSVALSEMLATELRAGEQLRTVPSEDVAHMRTNLGLTDVDDELSKTTLARVRKALDTDLVVLGAYSAMGTANDGEIRLDLRLQDTVAGETIASISETGRQSDLFALVSRAGGQLRRKLGIGGLLPMQVVNVRASMPSNPQAARLYVEGLERMRVFDRVGARDRFLKSIAVESTFPLSHAALAGAYDALGSDQKAKEQARKAFDFSADLSREDRLIVKGQYLSTLREWDHAVEAYRMLFELFPDNLDYGLLLAETQTSASKSNDALATVGRLRTLPPPSRDDPRIDLAEADALDRLEQWDKEEHALETTEAKAGSEGAWLLQARALERRCWVLSYLGRSLDAVNACREAEQAYGRVGDHFGEANTLCKWGDAIAGADPQGAIKLYKESLDLQRKIGSIHGQATVQNEMAIQYSNLGDHATARKLYQQSLAMFREEGDKHNVAMLMGNVADELMAMGQLKEAVSLYRDAIAAVEEMGMQPGNACYNLGTALQIQGDLPGAEGWFNKSLAMFRGEGDKFSSTYSLYSLGEIAFARNDLSRARSLMEQSLREREAAHEKISAAESRLDLAELDLEQGHAPPASEAAAAEAAQAFHAAKAFDSEALARALLARSLVAQQKPAEALAAVEQATAIAGHSQDPKIKLSVAVAEGRVRAAQGAPAQTAQAMSILNRSLSEADAHRYMGIALEARLALGEVEMKSGHVASGRARLEALERDARSRQFNLIASKAHAAALVASARNATTD